ncbi:hypothetical protein ACFQX9_37915 [Bradyrhizobium sp. GCM10028915]
MSNSVAVPGKPDPGLKASKMGDVHIAAGLDITNERPLESGKSLQ